MGRIICVCAEASEENCDDCEKYHRIKPDRTINCAIWKKEVKDKEEIKDKDED